MCGINCENSNRVKLRATNITVAILLSFICCLFLANATYAFSIAPARILITINPGTTEKFAVQVRNEEKNQEEFQIKILGFKQDGQGKPFFAENVDVAEKWVRADAERLVIKPGESKSVNFSITAPPAVAPGSHYLAIAAEAAPKARENKVTVNLSGQVASLLFLQIGGMVNESAQITKWESLKDWTAGQDWKFNLQLVNNGDVEVIMVGNIKINNWRGQNIVEEKINLGNQLLAHSVRFLRPEIKLRNKSVYLPGLYQAQISVKYGKTGQTTTALTHIWYVPKLAWVAVGILAATVMAIAVSMKKLFARISKVRNFKALDR